MTTPAIAIDHTLTISQPLKMERIRKSDGWVWKTQMYTSVETSERTVAKRPESSPSPVREDGSRAPKAWSNRWASFIMAPVDWTVSKPYGTDYIELYTMKPGKLGFRRSLLTEQTYEYIAQQVGLGWSAEVAGQPFPVNVDSKARTRFLNELGKGKMELGVALGELRETATGVRELAHDIGKAVQRIHRGLRASRSIALKDVVRVLARGTPKRRGRNERAKAYRRRLKRERAILKEWLRYQFSVKPLVLDVVAGAETLEYYLLSEERPFRAKFKKGGTSRWTARAVTYARIVNSTAFTLSTPMDCVASQHFSCVYDIVPTSERTLQQLGLNNPALVAWELVQFSWIVDYVWGVGDWINSFTRLDGMHFVEGSMSRITKARVDDAASCSPSGAFDFVKPSRVDAWEECEFGRFERTVLGTSPHPSFFPPFRSRLGISQMANTLAVVGLLLSKDKVSSIRNI